MSVTLTHASERNVLVDATEQRQAGEVLDALGGRPERLRIDDHDRSVPLPREIATLLAKVVQIMASGGTVTIGSLPEELTTTVAAEQLGVSRPTLMKMIKRKEIPAHKVGSHHRLKLSDVLEAKRTRLAQQRRALEELRELSDQLSDD